MRHRKSRDRVDGRELDSMIIRKVVLSLFHRRNDYGDASVSELIPELRKFGVTTQKKFRLLMKKHRRALHEDEGRRMQRAETSYLAKELGWLGIDVHANKSWCAIPGLVRQALELEYGEEAVVYVESQ